ncbi:hypothetical protein [Actinomadura rupiterrae]|uniref:hypothetical protein n=1 Tax=Actinomadura rupiterrae TaxID=559627 RepID=UPI0020A37248|nr:hypothetical protein [Actinomadura rupiterrae]MCP2334772.1 hypothetical protein [Actinomadura rupiterrae]
MRAWGKPAVLALAAASAVGLSAAPASAATVSSFSVPYGKSSVKGTVTWYADRAVFTSTELAADGCHVFAYVVGGKSPEQTVRNISCNSTTKRTVTVRVTSPNVAMVELFSFDLSGVSSSCYPTRTVCDKPVIVKP